MENLEGPWPPPCTSRGRTDSINNIMCYPTPSVHLRLSSNPTSQHFFPQNTTSPPSALPEACAQPRSLTWLPPEGAAQPEPSPWCHPWCVQPAPWGAAPGPVVPQLGVGGGEAAATWGQGEEELDFV